MPPQNFPHWPLVVRVLAAGALAYGLGAVIGSLLPNRGIALDVEVASWFEAHRTDAMTSLARSATTVGSPPGLVLTAAFVVAVLAWRMSGWRYPAAVLTVGVIGAELLTGAIKQTVERSRPPLSGAVVNVSAHGYSFPSGHATQSTAVYTLLAVVIAQRCRRRSARIAVAVLAVVAAVAVGLSRMYLGVHWLSDVASGWLIGLVWLMALGLAVSLLRNPGREALRDDST